jgi:hypothetical protein
MGEKERIKWMNGKSTIYLGTLIIFCQYSKKVRRNFLKMIEEFMA